MVKCVFIPGASPILDFGFTESLANMAADNPEGADHWQDIQLYVPGLRLLRTVASSREFLCRVARVSAKARFHPFLSSWI